MRLPSQLVLAITLVSSATMAATGDSLSLGMQLEPPTLDPTSAAAAAIDEVVYANVFEGLTRFAADGSIQPALAKSWQISDDGLTYTFELQDGVLFHDGTTFDAQDAKFSLDRARSETSTNAQKALFSAIDTVQVSAPTELVIKLAQADGALLFNLAWGDAVMVAPESIEQAKNHPIGTGPFTFEQWVQADKIVLANNPQYWGEPALLQQVTFKFISEPAAAFAAMMAGDLDAFPVYPAPENLAQFSADPRFQVLVGSTEGETILALNNQRAPFNNVKVRQAIAHAIDRSAIIDGAMFGYGTPIGTHFAPHHPAYLDLTAQSAYDLDKAKALLKEAGFEDGFSTTLKLPPPSYARRGGEIIAEQLRALGVDVQISNVEWAQWLEQAFRGKDFEMTIVSHTEPMDIGIYAKPDYYFQYGTSAMQALMADLSAQSDPDQRTELLQTAQRMIADDYVNAYLFQLPKTGVAAAKLRGLWLNSPTQANDLTKVYWAD